MDLILLEEQNGSSSFSLHIFPAKVGGTNGFVLNIMRSNAFVLDLMGSGNLNPHSPLDLLLKATD